MKDSILEFQVICQTNWGQSVCILGKSMRSNMQQKALTLYTNAKNYPKWKSSKVLKFKKNQAIQYKVFVSEHGKVKRYENLQNGQQKRQHTPKHQKQIVIIKFGFEDVTVFQSQKYDTSKQDFYGGPTRKFNEKDYSDDDNRSSSSLDYLDNFKRFQDFSIQTTFNLDYIANVYKEIVSRFQISQTKIDNKYGDGRVMTIDRKIVHIAKQKQNNMNQRNLFLQVKLEIGKDYIEDSFVVATQLMQKITVGQCFILHELQMCLVIKLIRKNLTTNNNYKIGLFISSLKNIQNILTYIEMKDLIESLILTNVMLFPSYQVMNQVLDLVQSFGILIGFQFHSIGHYTLNVYDRPILFKILNPHQQFSLSSLEFLSIHPQSVIKKRIQNIKFTQSQYRYAKVIIFSFGVHQNLNIIRNNKEIINNLCETHQVFAFIPNKLKQHSQIISMFPKILFVSYTYLEMQYMRKHKNIDNLIVFSQKFRTKITCLLQEYPNCTEELCNNHIFIKNTDRSLVGINAFQSLTVDVQRLVNNTNKQKNKQNTTLVIVKINSSTLMIRQAFQTQLFFTKVILQTIESKIDFIILFVFNRFQNFRFLEELKTIASQKNFNATVMAYTLGYVKNRHCYNIISSQFTEILTCLEECTVKSNKSRTAKKKSIGFLN